MKYYIHLRLFITIAFVFVLFILEEELITYFILGTLLLAITILANIKWIDKNIEYDHRFKLIKKSIVFKNYLYIPVLIIAYYTQPQEISIAGLLWLCFVLFIPMIVDSWIIQYKQPYTLFIKGNILKINQLNTNLERMLSDVNKLEFSSRNKNLYIYFTTQEDVLVDIREYNILDIEKFIDCIIEKSGQSLELPYNYIKYRNDVIKKKHTYGDRI